MPVVSKTLRVVVDELFLARLDQACQALHTTRSAFVREALQHALRRCQIARLKQQHADGYARYPVQTGELDMWGSEQIWDQP